MSIKNNGVSNDLLTNKARVNNRHGTAKIFMTEHDSSYHFMLPAIPMIAAANSHKLRWHTEPTANYQQQCIVSRRMTNHPTAFNLVSLIITTLPVTSCRCLHVLS